MKAERIRRKKLDEKQLVEQAQAANIRSVGADLGSSQLSRDEKIGRVDGLSSIMERSVVEAKAPPTLMDDGDYLRVQAEIKELLRTDSAGKPTTFDDLLQLMGKPKFRKEG